MRMEANKWCGQARVHHNNHDMTAIILKKSTESYHLISLFTGPQTREVR